MNLQENILRIKEVMQLNETVHASNIKDINWYGLINSGRNFWKQELYNNVKIPENFQPYVSKLLVSFTNDLKEYIENDVTKGSLSQSTIDKFNTNVSKVLSEMKVDKFLNSELSKIPKYQRNLAKTVGASTIKNAVNKAVDLTGLKLFKQGMVNELTKTYDVNSPLVKNYIKVANQMGDYVSKNENLKKDLYELVMSKL